MQETISLPLPQQWIEMRFTKNLLCKVSNFGLSKRINLYKKLIPRALPNLGRGEGEGETLMDNKTRSYGRSMRQITEEELKEAVLRTALQFDKALQALGVSSDEEAEEILSQGEMTEARRKELESKFNEIWDKDSGKAKSDTAEAEE